MQKYNNKELSSIEDKKVNTNLCYDGRKRFYHLASSVPSLRGALPHILVNQKLFFLEHHATTRKPTLLQKRKITFNRTYQRWSPRGRLWPRGHILKSLALALASKPQVLRLGLEALGPRKLPCPRFEDSTIF